VSKLTQVEARRDALRNLLFAIDMHSKLPHSVFQGSWSSFLFFESDRAFTLEFADAITELLRAESTYPMSSLEQLHCLWLQNQPT
jgi:hypothetical protein